jgi:hypothetical protein
VVVSRPEDLDGWPDDTAAVMRYRAALEATLVGDGLDVHVIRRHDFHRSNALTALRHGLESAAW